MQQQVVVSPCVSVCEIDNDTGFCIGCLRTRQEIALWSRADLKTRIEILDRLHARREEQGGGARRKTRRRE